MLRGERKIIDFTRAQIPSSRPHSPCLTPGMGSKHCVDGLNVWEINYDKGEIHNIKKKLSESEMTNILKRKENEGVGSQGR